MAAGDRGLAERTEPAGPPGGAVVAPRRYGTLTGEPCPRTVRVDGDVEGTGDCLGCGACLLGTGLV